MAMIVLSWHASAGQKMVKTGNYVVGGYPITTEQVPFQVSVRWRWLHEFHFGRGHVCGGSLLSQRVVCSAAHCYAINQSNPLRYRSSELYVVVAGSTFIEISDSTTQEFLVQELSGHWGYNHSTLVNDIALLFLNGFINWRFTIIRPIRLPKTPPQPGTFCAIGGWGKVGKLTMMHQGIVPIWHNRHCSVIYKNLPASQMCAGYLTGGTDACQGDSGSPLHCAGELAGIVSWGIGCGNPGFPGVYTNVSSYIEWIRSHNSTFNYSYYARMRHLQNIANNWNYNLFLLMAGVIIASKS
ncbi:trypsin I-P1 [Scaptodrosophila lebanonensis]|uniref:Trypsin I-P1 n=1 Tax=Drosophila lebanonensis TaxID=7225 RepID=A0A6J2TY79_DROLE|nr:trypsin I-P1 [Scaptodrosophila lebanonensis]